MACEQVYNRARKEEIGNWVMIMYEVLFAKMTREFATQLMFKK